MWQVENEGAKFWLNVLTKLNNLGMTDIIIANVDGLKVSAPCRTSVSELSIRR